MATPPASYGYPKAAITADKLPIWQQPLARFTVAGASDWKVSSLASIDRGIRVEAGTGSGDAVTDVTFEYETMSLPSPPIASAWYLIVRRRNWSGNGTSTLVAIRGTAVKALPTPGTGSGNRRDAPGEESDQPLALVRVTQKDTTVQEIVDLRCWAANGGVEVADQLALGYLESPGAAVKLGNTVWRYDLQANGVWGWDDGNTGWRDLTLGATPGVAGVRGAGAWNRISGTPAQARLVAGGTMVQVRGDLTYVNPTTPNYMPTESWVIATVPAGMAPSGPAYITGTSDRFRKSQVYVINPNGTITIGPGFAGTIAQFNGLAPL